MSVKALASHFEVSRIAVMKHLRALEECQLVLSKKVGRTRHLFFNPVSIQLVYDRWSTKFSSFWSGHLADIKARVELHAEDGENQIA
jgi:predicted transcriptional regulator